MSRESWISFPDVAESTDGVIVVGHSGLPAVIHPEWLQVNTRVLQRSVINWGGYASLTLAGRRGDSDQVSISVGADASGNAYGTGAATVAKADTINSQAASDVELDRYNVRNGELGVVWNVTALNDQLSLDQQHDPYVRAAQIDRVVRRQLLKNVITHNTTENMRNHPKIANVVNAAVDGVFIYSAEVFNSIAMGHYIDLATQLSLRTAFMQVVLRNAQRKFASTVVREEPQYSDMITDPLFFTARPVRAGIAAATLLNRRLIRVAPTS